MGAARLCSIMQRSDHGLQARLANARDEKSPCSEIDRLGPRPAQKRQGASAPASIVKCLHAQQRASPRRAR